MLHWTIDNFNADQTYSVISQYICICQQNKVINWASFNKWTKVLITCLVHLAIHEKQEREEIYPTINENPDLILTGC